VVLAGVVFKDGLCFLLIHADIQDSVYWATGSAHGLMLRPVPGESGDIYERVGYVKIFHVRISWWNTLETRRLTLVLTYVAWIWLKEAARLPGTCGGKGGVSDGV
jgi:hypothetical protein